MLFEDLAQVYAQIESISSGNEMREVLAAFYTKVPKEEIARISYLTLGHIAPEYEKAVLGFAEKSIIKAIARAGAISEKQVKTRVDTLGDAGLAAQELLQKKPQTLVPLEPLTIKELFEGLVQLSKTSGTKSQDIKTTTLATLLQRATPLGATYITRIVQGSLRLGAGDMTVLSALAIAFTQDKKNKEILESAYNICPDVGHIADTLVKKGLAGVQHIEIQVGRPIKMMAAQRVSHFEEIAKKIPGEITVEAKYDGERVQVHVGKEISLFSRRMDTITYQYPDLVAAIKKNLQVTNCIFEAEILAYDKEGKHLPFQTLMQRRRKTNIEEYVKKIPVQLKMFDALYLNGESLLDTSLPVRLEKLATLFSPNKKILLADSIITADHERIQAFFEQITTQGHEGIMLKSRAQDSTYQAGVRGWQWIKWKKDYDSEMSDTVDLVVIGAYSGRGKRAGVYGALLCACYNAELDQFETVCKLGTGLTDEVLAQLPKSLKNHIMDHKPPRVVCEKQMEPDVWFEPFLVVEVLAAEITKSPTHTLGLALRFPRFISFRHDKSAEQATTSTEIEKMV